MNTQVAASILAHIANSREAEDAPYTFGHTIARMLLRYCRTELSFMRKAAMAVYCAKYLPNDSAFVLFHNGVRDKLRAEGVWL